MREPALHAHDDGLGHLVGDDFADAFFTDATLYRDIFGFFSHTK